MDAESMVKVAISDAPALRRTADDIVELSARTVRRRRARWLIGGAAAATLAVTAAVALPRAFDGAGGDTPPAQRAAAAERSAPTAAAAVTPVEPFAFTLKRYSVGRITVEEPRTVSTAYEGSRILVDGSLLGYLTMFRPGVFDPSGFSHDEATTIAGRPALQGSAVRPPTQEGWPTMTDRFLAWEYADRSWATIETFSQDPDAPSARDLRGVAAGLVTGRPTEAKLPFTLAHVPAGYRPVEVGMHAWAGRNGLAAADQANYAGVLFAKPAPRLAALSAPWDPHSHTDLPDNFDIAVVKDTPRARPAEPRCADDGGFCVQWRDGGRVKLYVSSEGRLSEQEMGKVLRGIKLASAGDVKTWKPATAAIPVRP